VQFADPPVTASRAEQFRYLLNVGTILMVLDRNAEAMQHLEKAEQIFAGLCGQCILALCKRDRSREYGVCERLRARAAHFDKLGSIDDAPAALARIYEQDGRYAEEAEVLRSAADQSKRSHWLYLMLGNVELHLGRADLALAAFQNAERESPFRGEAYALGEEFRSQIAAGKQRAMQSMAGK
jgi:tetratricopeptide (TPR) repeat protein